MPVSVLIYEDNANLRDSLGKLITFSGGLMLLAAFGDVKSVEPQVRELNPDVILMDIDMPGLNGIEAVKKIRNFNGQVQIIMITIFDDNRHVLDAIMAGANGYLLKKNLSDQLTESVEQVMKGEAPMSPGIARMVIQHLQQPAAPVENLYQLTSREKQILSGLSKGNSYKMIASEFGISIDTVRTHIKRIYEKLQVHSQTEAVSKAVNEKLV